MAGGLARVVGESEELNHQDVIILAAPADSQALERVRHKYASATPEVKAKLSHHIERGGVGDEVNVICVCPNHYRQIHYGRVTLAEHEDEFVFAVDGAAVRVRHN